MRNKKACLLNIRCLYIRFSIQIFIDRFFFSPGFSPGFYYFSVYYLLVRHKYFYVCKFCKYIAAGSVHPPIYIPILF